MIGEDNDLTDLISINNVFNCHYDVSVWEKKWEVWK